MKRILIMGLPGSGKTTLAEALIKKLEAAGKTVSWFNGDHVRKIFNDWDFSPEGRIRQSLRMKNLSETTDADFVIADFVAPLEQMRINFEPHWIIWVDTIQESRFEDTNKMFEHPSNYNFRINTQDKDFWTDYIAPFILEEKQRAKFDWQKETCQMLGRWQPWHSGHQALFERALEKTGQVCIMIRDCQGWNDSNPFETNQVKNFIKAALDPLYQGQYEILFVPNIVHITYGRSVGYKIEQEFFDDATHAISATNIRKEMGLT